MPRFAMRKDRLRSKYTRGISYTGLRWIRRCVDFPTIRYRWFTDSVANFFSAGCRSRIRGGSKKKKKKIKKVAGEKATIDE